MFSTYRPNPPNGGLLALWLEGSHRYMEAGFIKLPDNCPYVPPGQITSSLLIKVLCQVMKAIAAISIWKHKGYNDHQSYLSNRNNADVPFHVDYLVQ